MVDPAEVEQLAEAWFEAAQDGRDVPLADLAGGRPDVLAALEQAVVPFRKFIRFRSQPPPEPLPAAIGRRFRVRRELGRGAMGRVVAAVDRASGAEVAVKLILADRLHDAAVLARFAREARAAAKLAHDHLMPVLEIGPPDGPPYFVMPRLAGETLADRLARGPLAGPDVARLGRHLAAGLAATHAAGIVHRDVKPSNVWLEDAPTGWRARLMDFGLARDRQDLERLTKTGQAVGTPKYMSPEQVEASKGVGPPADAYALGVVLYEAATGTHPYGGPTPVGVFDTLEAIRSGRRDVATLHAAGLPSGLADLILRLLAMSPAERPTAATAAAELAGLDTPS